MMRHVLKDGGISAGADIKIINPLVDTFCDVSNGASTGLARRTLVHKGGAIAVRALAAADLGERSAKLQLRQLA